MRPAPNRRSRIGAGLVGWLVTASLSAAPGPAPLPGLGEAQLTRYREGLAQFEQRWVVAPSAFGTWGRGPTSNAAACSECHVGHARGSVPDAPDVPLVSAVVRFSREDAGSDPAYGLQLQTQGVLGRVPAEGAAFVRWTAREYRYPDGRRVQLREPAVALEDLAFGPLANGTRVSIRVAPSIRTAAWLEVIPAEALVEHERRYRSRYGRGRLNRLLGPGEDSARIARFGWKATVATLEDQIALAFHEDLGVTSLRHPEPNCPSAQSACRAEPVPAAPEADESRIASLADHLRLLRPPSPPRDTLGRGAALFRNAGCAECHVPSWPTGDGASSHGIARIHPYTDLMLHDMGDALAGGAEGAATAREWRTAPLWGASRSHAPGSPKTYLHDGRARTLEEAILWHGGEAAAARVRFSALGRRERAVFLRYLEGL